MVRLPPEQAVVIRSLGLRDVSVLASNKNLPARSMSTRVILARIQFKIQAAISEADPKMDLAAIGHGLELPTLFPWFLLVPRDGGPTMIVGVADEGGFLLRCARSKSDHKCAHQDRNDDCSKLKDLCQHKSHCLQVVLGRRAPSYCS